MTGLTNRTHPGVRSSVSGPSMPVMCPFKFCTLDLNGQKRSARVKLMDQTHQSVTGRTGVESAHARTHEAKPKSWRVVSVTGCFTTWSLVASSKLLECSFYD
jgi:hypothetical protein